MEDNKVYYCKNCGVEIDKERHDKAIEDKWLPLCEKCNSEIRAKFEEWYPKFRDFRF